MTIPYIGKSFDETCKIMGIGDVFGKLDAGDHLHEKVDSKPHNETAEETEASPFNKGTRE